jgi:hypothetical protein
MNAIKLVSKISTFISVASFVITAISAVATYFLLNIVSASAPAEYYALYTLTSILPLLLVAVIALIIAVMTRGAKAEKDIQDEALPQDETEKAFEEDNA